MHQTRRPPRPDWTEQTQTSNSSNHPTVTNVPNRHEYYCWPGEHWFELEQADYCDTCGLFICSQHEHDCLFAQKAED